jgi:glycosyltransferase involved in cell wall biosynthesis
VEAAAAVTRERPHSRFYLVGEGPLREAPEAQAHALGLGDRFVFVGFVRDVASAWAAFDVCAFPSLWEGTPLTVFEALAAGKPIVATDADGLSDVLAAGETARIVPKADAAALAREIVWLMDRPAERQRLSAAARLAARDYDISAFVRKMERLYTGLHEVSRRTRRRGILQQDLSYLGGGIQA